MYPVESSRIPSAMMMWSQKLLLIRVGFIVNQVYQIT